jgi:hypothetical protein
VSIRVSRAGVTVGCVLLLVAFTVVLAGCTPGDSGQTTTTEPDSGVTSTVSTGESTSTTEPELMSEWDKELAKTARLQNQVAALLQEQGAAENDPRKAVMLGLRARTQALTCRKALDGKDLNLADSAIKDVRYMLNLAGNVATGSVATILTDARETISTVGLPSDDPDHAAAALDLFIAALAPLLDEATALLASTTTTT